MRTARVAQLPTWRSTYQAQLLWWLLCGPDDEYSLADLSRRTGIARATTHDEITRLLEAGLLRERRLGGARLISANDDHPATEHLRALAHYTYGPLTVLENNFGDLGARSVIVFGSWAARHHGHPGPAPNDIDVLILADADTRREVRSAAFAAAEAVESEIGLPVHLVVRDEQDWNGPQDDPLITQIKAEPSVVITEDLS